VVEGTQAPGAAGGNYAFNKLSPLWRTVYGVGTGKDPFSGNPIHYHPDDPTGIKDYLSYVWKEMSPIGLGTAEQRQPTANVSIADIIAGIRPASMAQSTPAAVAESYVRYQNQQAQRRALRQEARKNAAAQAPAAPPTAAPAAPAAAALPPTSTVATPRKR
jgi:hypothetical protein